MRLILSIVLLLFSLSLFSQTKISAEIVDSQTKQPLSFCSIIIKGTTLGTISNTEGVFIISVPHLNDILVISYLGYEKMIIPAKNVLEQKTILLKKKTIELQSVNVVPDNDFLFVVVAKCRNNLLNNYALKQSKVYYSMETNSKTLSVEYPTQSVEYKMTQTFPSDTIPVELLECFYNSSLSGHSVDELQYKSGRTAIAASDNYFLTLNISKAICKINLTEKNYDFPSIPLQFGKNVLKKHFKLELFSSDSNILQIKFYPLDNAGFAGDIWIEKKTYNLIKINLKSENTAIHPFLPIHPNTDRIKNVSFDITANYKVLDKSTIPDHIYFNYSFTYSSRRDSLAGLKTDLWKNMTREIYSFGIMYFYDYGKPFTLPYFTCSDQLWDYHKMSFIPYNEDFWKSNNIMLLTENQKRNFDIIAQNGQLINFPNSVSQQNSKDSLSPKNGVLTYLYLETFEHFLEFYYAFWSADKRVIPNTESPQFETYSTEKIRNSIRGDLYDIKVQILLDIAESGDSLRCSSYCVFDNAETFYHLPLNKYTNAFINIYFDICEIERRKMQKTLDSKSYSLSQIDSIYKETQKSINDITSKYKFEVELGEIETNFEKWNLYVFQNLNIDNIKLVENSFKDKK